ncbi:MULTISPECIES: branched-chain amino acid ABC transporter permease [Brevibacillus]|uniref:Branched-chain amino acid ABC transporter permease n=1 Tax=Brevibacillus brevis TaxID=1393 RepID=A0A0J6BL96_BREBE|nr:MULTISPECIES: branched-chain amino acid ABC transporter permease [Brevibacillus]AWX55147.1 branched-chain amino acid ABC transporter permease [Brevibacillus brevis]NRR22030.1 branched-chain amino acid ABC transporter permease [Brevibacillus sp. MS2.2]PSJ64663.1 branched-chain amino acid ABC transporter permease [Brevibacillus brevis]RAT95917.1 branched-chain amino acid ABC transporter permease [Brevibacillus sp. Leaf182]RED32848.1 branched-chain amino acid transport system permease protein 
MFWQQLVNGLTVGSTYSLIALGYTLIFGVLGIINMAHGQIFIFGSLVGLVLMTSLNMPLGVALIVAVVISAILGLVLEYTALRPLRKKNVPHLASLISTIGFAILMEEAMHKFFGADSRAFPQSFGDTTFDLGLIQIRSVDLVILGISVLLMFVLHFWIQKTKMGKAIRATAENTDTANILGINTNMVIVVTVMLASALGGVAGILIGMAYSALIPTMGMTLGFKGLAVLILGGVGSIPGAMVCGVLLGIIEVFTVAYGDSSYRDAVAFGLIILILLLKPEGLFGRKA